VDPAPQPAPIPTVSAEEGVVSGTWVQRPGLAMDIGVFRKDQAWIIGTNQVAGGFGIYRLVGNNWVAVPGGAVRITVGPNGPWIVNSQNNIFRWNGAGFVAVPGAAWDIGVGADGNPWIIGTNAVPGGFGVWQWNGASFVAVPGGGVRI